MKTSTRLAEACLSAGFCIAMACQQVAAEDAARPNQPARNGATPQIALSIEEYQIGPHDLIELSVFQVPEMSRTVRVNARGQISLPLIGAVSAGGLTAQELEAAIANKLSETYLQDPQVSIFIKEYISQRVTVEGSVKTAGVYPLTGRTTLLQVIAMANGVDTIANENEVKIFRVGSDGSKALVFDLDAIRAGKTDDPQIKGNDLVVVDRSATRSAVKNISDTIRGIFQFTRW